MTQDDIKLVLEALKFCHGGEPCGTAEAIVVVEKALAQRTYEVLRLALEALYGFIPYLPIEHDKPQCDRYNKAVSAIEAKLKEKNT